MEENGHLNKGMQFRVTEALIDVCVGYLGIIFNVNRDFGNNWGLTPSFNRLKELRPAEVKWLLGLQSYLMEELVLESSYPDLQP